MKPEFKYAFCWHKLPSTETQFSRRTVLRSHVGAFLDTFPRIQRVTADCTQVRLRVYSTHIVVHFSFFIAFFMPLFFFIDFFFDLAMMLECILQRCYLK